MRLDCPTTRVAEIPIGSRMESPPAPIARSNSLPIGKAEIVEISGVRRQLGVSVHLIVHGNTVPAGGHGERRIGLIQVSSYAVQGNGLV